MLVRWLLLFVLNNLFVSLAGKQGLVLNLIKLIKHLFVNIALLLLKSNLMLEFL